MKLAVSDRYIDYFQHILLIDELLLYTLPARDNRLNIVTEDRKTLESFTLNYFIKEERHFE